MITILRKVQAFLRSGKGTRMIVESWSTSWPMVLIMTFEFLIGLSDVYIAGRLGKEVQAAYGFVFQAYFISIVLANSITVGTVSVISKLFTGGDKDKLSTAVFSSLAAVVVGGGFFTLVGIFLVPRFIALLSLPEVVKVLSVPLFEIYALGLFFHYILINTNGILRSTKLVILSLKTMASVCLLNVCLNFFFLLRTDMGFRGIAVATVLAVSLGCFINLIHVSRFLKGVKRISFDVIKRILNVGWPILVLQVAWQVGAMMVFIIVGMMPKNSVELLAALTNGLRIESAIFLPAFAFNLSSAVITGNLMGEGRKNDAFRNGLVTAGLGVSFVTILAVIVISNAKTFMSFLSDNGIVIREGVKYLYICILAEPFMVWSVILGGALSGAGDTRTVMRIVALSVWVVRIPLCYTLGIFLGLGAVAVWWSMNTSLLIQGVFMTKRYFSKGWLEHA